MKKFWLSLGLTLILTCWCGAGYYGLGTGAAFGQDYYNRSLSCNPSDPSCYHDYYRAPNADPLSQLLYYIAPPVSRDYRYETPQRYHQETKWERKDREKREKRERKDRDHNRQGY
jgi:hypothetical protein